ncbi:MAG: hypothetical protein HY300_13100 [Verrucomicrobia bacterium]|nr:hypothetical protein [Verrucomicrobiota bacterium]
MNSHALELIRGNWGLALFSVVLGCLALLVLLLAVQRRQLRAMEKAEMERRLAEQHRAEQERTALQIQHVERDARVAREQQLQQARQLMADAIATLDQIRRQSQ